MNSEQDKSEGSPVPPAPQPSVTTATAAVARAKESVVEADLSTEIAAAIEREPGDRVRVTRISGTHYRCNWWAADGKPAPQSMPGLVTTTHVVRKSRFLSVTKVAGGLLINDRPARAGTPG